MPTDAERIALDRASVRTIDQDGHLHVAASNLTRAAVNRYAGREIPGYEALGLDANRIYRLFRDPAELERAAATFNGKPLLSSHRPQTAADHDHMLTVGAVNNVSWRAPFLVGELSVWDGDAIAGIDSGAARELSAGYRYVPVMTPGTFEGAAYDGVMTEIVANHVSLVETGRAGPDVVVGDNQLQENDMAQTARLSRPALLASGALRAYLRPKLAADAKINVGALLSGVTAQTFKAGRPALRLAMDAACRGKLAKDASLSDVDSLLDELQDAIDDLATEPDPDDETEEERAARLAAKSADKPAEDEEDKDKDKDKDKGKPAMDSVTRVAMDAALATSAAKVRADTMAEMRAIQAAERAVRPHIGDVEVACDSAEGVYRLALDFAGINVTGVPPAAFKAMVGMLPLPGTAAAPRPRIAQDEADAETAFRAKFPTAVKLVRS